MWIINSFSYRAVEAYEIRTMLNYYSERQNVIPKPYYNMKDIELYRTLSEFLSTFNKTHPLTIGLSYNFICCPILGVHIFDMYELSSFHTNSTISAEMQR